jgi:uncharacterized membrane protein YeaQ/YmgE (transglycosylase-associated protein family)
VPALKDRPIQEIVVIYLTGIVGFVIGTTVIGIFLLAFTSPSSDTSRVLSSIIGLTNTIVGGVVGFIAGRATNRPTPNENEAGHPPGAPPRN